MKIKKQILILIVFVLVVFLSKLVFEIASLTIPGKWKPVSLDSMRLEAWKSCSTTYSYSKGKTASTSCQKYYSVNANGVGNLLIQDKDGISAFMSMEFDNQTGVIFGRPFFVGSPGCVYLGKGILDNKVIKPVFLEGTQANYNKRAECGEFKCPGIKFILPITYNDSNKIFIDETKGTIQ